MAPRAVSAAPGQSGAIPNSKAPKVHPRLLSHFAIFATDVNAAIDFYEKTLGLRLSDKSDLEIRIPFMNNHRLRFDRNVGRVVEVTGQYKVVDGKKTLVSLKAAKAP